MNLKKKIKRVLAISMAFSMVFCSNAFATPIDVVNSTEDVKTDTLTKTEGTDYFNDEVNEWQSGTINEEVRVKVDLASQFTVTIPKEIVLDGETGKADYKVKAVGDIAGDQVLNVVPDTDFVLSEKSGKDNQTATVTQQDTQYTYQELKGTGTEYDGNISATLSAGEWSGKFSFNINFKASLGPVLPAKDTFNNMSWADIATVSEAGKAPEYFSVGDEKELTIGKYSYSYDADGEVNIETHSETTYHVQILGFNHDDKSDGTGKAGITVGLKEIMTTVRVMNSTDTNVGGWETSEMRTYVNGDVYNNLPQEVKDVIKPVDKLTSEGNTSTNITTTSDKLFLLSEVEIFGSTTKSASGEGSQYQYFTDGGLTKKYKSGFSYIWWERSPGINNTYDFCNVEDDGSANDLRAFYDYGVVFGFAI